MEDRSIFLPRKQGAQQLEDRAQDAANEQNCERNEPTDDEKQDQAKRAQTTERAGLSGYETLE